MSQAKALLVVEDEPLIRMMMEDLLRNAGYMVHTAENGTDAVQAISEPELPVHGLVTDVRLGTGPDGWAVARYARELCPKMPVVYVTGDSAHEWAAQGVPQSILVQKPFRGAQITKAVISLLN